MTPEVRYLIVRCAVDVLAVTLSPGIGRRPGPSDPDEAAAIFRRYGLPPAITPAEVDEVLNLTLGELLTDPELTHPIHRPRRG